ncbi:MAG: hypothetical protein RR201_02380 [Malacoplasma sp.]
MSASRTKKFLYNSMSMLLLQIVTMIVGFITPHIMLQYYGSEINGLVSSITQFITYFNLVEAGLSSAAIYALYKPLADNDHKKISGVVTAAKRFYNISGYIFVSLTVGLALIYPLFIKTNTLMPFEVGLLVLVLGVSGALEFFTLGKYRALLSADQKTYVISIATILSIILNCLIIVICAYFHMNIVLLKGIALLSVFLRSFILWIYSLKNYSYIDYKEIPNNKALDKRWSALYLQILGAVQVGAPVVLATLFTDLKMVSVYSIFNMVIGGINGLLGIFTSGLSASFGEVIAKNETKVLQKSYSEFEYIYYSLVAIVYGVSAITLMPFIKLYTSGILDTNYNLPLVGALFIINGLLYNLKTPQGMLVISAGLYKETKWQTTIQGCIVVVGGIVLAPRLGLNGILIASILSNLYRNIDLIFFIPKWVTKLPIKNSLLRIILVGIALFIIWIPFNYIVISISSYITWLFYAISITIYSIFVVGLMGFIFDHKNMFGLLKRFKRLRG